jgi:hypothetical protein
MKLMNKIALTGFLLIFVSITLAGGTGDFRLGYTYLDEDGNQSVNQSSFNYYDGVGVSFENFYYRFDNGIKMSSDLSNINLDNRNLFFEITKPGLFGAKVRSNQFRRVYSFDGSDRTKRNLTSAGVWVNPQRYVKLFVDGSFNNLSGTSTDLFGSDFVTIPERVDYNRNKFNFGGVFNYQGRMFHAEYGTSKFNDEIDGARDQSRENIILRALAPVPRFEWLVLTGIYHRFETKYDDSGFKIKSTTAKGSAFADLPDNFALTYYVIFNRAGSDSDFVETDNLAHAVYLMYDKPQRFGATLGYQNDVKDDYEDEVIGNSFYLAGWYMPATNFELKGEYGYRAEDVDEGSRLVGDENRNRFKLYGKYKANGKGSIKVGTSAKMRRNDQLDSKVDYTNVYAEGILTSMKYANVSAGYSYVIGKYENAQQTFEFDSHQVHGEIQTRQYKHFTGEFGMIYYRSQRDLDVESFNLRFKLGYQFPGGSRFEAAYNVFNFDDLMFLDRYYTENIVEINIIKTFKF